MLRRSVVVLALALTLCALPLAAQEPPPQQPGAPEAQPTEAAPQDEKGPNLQPPIWLSAAQKEQLEAATRVWEDAYATYRRQGATAARPKVDRAIALLLEARGIDARCAIPDHYLGIAYQLTGEFDEAIERLRDAVRKNARFHEAMVELGDAYRWADKVEDAFRLYDQAIATKPDYAHAYKMRALLRVNRERFEDARADVTRALELAPEDAEARAIEQRLAIVLEGPRWERKFTAETRNYVVYTNVDQAFADEVAKQAELIRRLYTQVFPRPPRARRLFPIVVFGSAQEYHQNGGPRGAGGHFDPEFKQLFLFKYPQMSDTLLVLYHEGFHQFLDSIIDTHVPQWFNEGVADFFGPSEYVTQPEEGMRFRPNPWRLDLVKQMIGTNAHLPFEQLMNMTQQQMYEPQAAGRHYAQAWSIVYFLARCDEGAYFDYLKDYFSALRRGKNAREAYTAAFGRADMGAMQARWRDFISTLQRQ